MLRTIADEIGSRVPKVGYASPIFTYSAASIIDRLVVTREADLTLFLGYELPLAAIPVAMPLGRLAAGIVRRLPPVGEMMAALVIVIGGMAATGAASLL